MSTHVLTPAPPGCRFSWLRRSVMAVFVATGLAASLAASATAAPNGVAISPGGQLLAWGSNFDDQTVVPVLPDGVTYVAVAPSQNNYSMALTSEGEIKVWGDTRQ